MVIHWLRNERNGPWLLVIDNADDADVLSQPPATGQQPKVAERLW